MFLLSEQALRIRGHFYITEGHRVGGTEYGNFPLLYVVKCPYVGGLVVQKSLKTPLRNIKMAPKGKAKEKSH